MEQHVDWHGKPYYSLDAYCKNTFRQKCYKIALDAHMNCPNRDGSLDTRGCIFCSAGGSGDFAVPAAGRSITEQLEEGLSLMKGKKTGQRYIAYFQAFTNTYAPLPYLEETYSQALCHPDVIGISIATRPDCISSQVLALLDSLRERYDGKFIWIELGLQTIHEATADFIRRGYRLPCFEQTFERLRIHRLPVIIHVILGLPGESRRDMEDTIRYINIIKPFGIKLQLLHVLEHTDLADYYRSGRLTLLTQEEYLSILIRSLELLSPDIVVHRVTGDGPRQLLLAPSWSVRKRDILNTLHLTMRQSGTRQGALYQTVP